MFTPDMHCTTNNSSDDASARQAGHVKLNHENERKINFILKHLVAYFVWCRYDRNVSNACGHMITHKSYPCSVADQNSVICRVEKFPEV